MQLIVDIPSSKVSFAQDVLKSLSFVKAVKPLPVKIAMPIKLNKKELFLADLEQSAEEVKAAIKGKKKLKTLEEALNEI